MYFIFISLTFIIGRALLALFVVGRDFSLLERVKERNLLSMIISCLFVDLQRSKGEPLRGFEDEKFSFVAFRRGQRPRLVFLSIMYRYVNCVIKS